MNTPAPPLAGGDPLAPYVPSLAPSWPAGAGQWQVIDGPLVFADISGFTRLTEELAERGKAGAEELTGFLDSIFSQLLERAYRASGELVKWGGDAALVFFAGAGHAERAVSAAWKMQLKMQKLGRLRISAGPSRLAMSVGVHSGLFHFLLVGARHRELVVTGPGATATVAMEPAAGVGEIVVSPGTAARLAARVIGARKGRGYLVVEPPRRDLPGLPVLTRPTRQTADAFLPEATRSYLLAGPLEGEHRQVAVGFVEFGGTDRVVLQEGPHALSANLARELLRKGQCRTK